MKKIFYILASAIVALGAVACENEGMENIAPEVNGDTVSFVANIDNTKTDLNGVQTIWKAGDVIIVTWNGTDYEFKNTEKASSVFSCTAEGLSAIEGQLVEAWYNKKGVDSSAGTAGAQLYAKGSFGETLQFEIKSAFLKFTTKGTFKDPFVLTNGDFTWSKQEEGTYYIAVEAGKTTTLNYSIGGVTQKEAEITPVAGKIYKLGELTAEEYAWGLVGQHQGWDITNPSRMYKTADGKGYARCGVKLQDNGFKFAKTGLKDWNTANTSFGAWKKTSGKDFFNYSTEMGVGAWYGVYTNNLGGQSNNIGVSDFTKTYDIYVKVMTDADWGQELGYTVVTAGTKVTF